MARRYDGHGATPTLQRRRRALLAGRTRRDEVAPVMAMNAWKNRIWLNSHRSLSFQVKLTTGGTRAGRVSYPFQSHRSAVRPCQNARTREEVLYGRGLKGSL